MVYGRPPFAHIQSMMKKIYAIPDPTHEINYPSIDNPALLDAMKRCLQRNPKERLSIPDLLSHAFLRPLASSEKCN